MLHMLHGLHVVQRLHGLHGLHVRSMLLRVVFEIAPAGHFLASTITFDILGVTQDNTLRLEAVSYCISSLEVASSPRDISVLDELQNLGF